MNDDRLKATGLDEAEINEPNDGSNEWNRDSLLIELEVKLGSIKRGSFNFYCKYILPLAIALIISGSLLTYTLTKIKTEGPLWLIIISEVSLIIGIFALLAVVVILVMDKVRLSEIESIDNDDLSSIECEFFKVQPRDDDQVPSCEYFNRDLTNEPLCLICPVNSKTAES